MFKARNCGWIRLLPLFMLSLPVQAELRCVANAVDIESFFSAATAEDKQQVEQAINSSVNLVPFGLSASNWKVGNDSNLLIVFYVQIMPDDFVMQLHR
ncbi:hypothetical protein RZR22_24035, partial [Escherichia coli]|nr:hypothetical protein [Escherichia coli]